MAQQKPMKGYLKIRLEDDLLEALAEEAQRNERTTAAEARVAIRKHVPALKPRQDIRA